MHVKKYWVGLTKNAYRNNGCSWDLRDLFNCACDGEWRNTYGIEQDYLPLPIDHPLPLSFRHPFPCPTTFRVALSHYVDISAPVKAHVLKAIAEFATDEEQKKKLILMSNSEGEGHVSASQFSQLAISISNLRSRIVHSH